MTFESLNLSEAIVSAVRELGYTEPTPIQAQAIPLVLQGKDLLAGAQTGTGKTAAFTLPILEMLSKAPQGQTGAARPIRALILTPTRELAAQIEENIREYAKNIPIKAAVIFGGVGMAAQINKLNRGVDILVATPGRLLDLQNQGHIDFGQVEFLVLDEADRMLDMGFIHDVKKILALLPAKKQSLLFSATFSDDIKHLANSLLNKPEQVQVTPPNTTVQRITQVICPVGRSQKKAALLHIITSKDWSQVLVFTRTKFGANHVAEYLNKNGVTAMALHGNKSQTARTQALSGFKSGELKALVATDIAARGIDIDELPHVVNYEIPNVPEDYVHRIGRTGRAGAKGDAVSLVCLDEEGFMMEIERFTKQEIPVEMMPEFGPAADETAEPIAMGRQTIWGGAGRPPSRDIMQAAAKKARKEMMERIRTKAPAAPARNKPRSASAQGDAGGDRSADDEGHNSRPLDANGNPIPRQNRTNRNTRTTNVRGRRSGSSSGAGETRPRAEDGAMEGQGRGGDRSEGAPRSNNRPAKPRTNQGAPAHRGDRNDRSDRGDRGDRNDRPSQPRAERGPMLREDAHLGTQAGASLAAPKRSGGGQPDPMRTSVDMMAQRASRGAPRSGGRGFGGGGGAGGGHFGGGASRGSNNRGGNRGGR